MHNFSNLIYKSTIFTLNAIEEANSKALNELETGASTIAVEILQMNRLQKMILAVGMFSSFESFLQEELSCQNGFKEAKKILMQKRKKDLHNRFMDFYYAINVLKHGKGMSYEALVAKSGALPFKLRLPGENFFEEGDVGYTGAS